MTEDDKKQPPITRIILVTILTSAITALMTTCVKDAWDRSKEVLRYCGVGFETESDTKIIPVINVGLARRKLDYFVVAVFNQGLTPQHDVSVLVRGLGEVVDVIPDSNIIPYSLNREPLLDFASFRGTDTIAFTIQNLPPSSAFGLKILAHPSEVRVLPTINVASSTTGAERIEPEESWVALMQAGFALGLNKDTDPSPIRRLQWR